MKATSLLVAFCLLAGWASSEFAWKTGKTYTYVVRGRLMTGISEINTQYSGLEMDYKIMMTVVDGNTLVLKPSEFKVLEVHDKLNGGWRDARLENQRPVELTDDFRTYLESPVVLRMNRGLIQSIKVEHSLPVWAINIKKAQVSHFMLDTVGVNTVLEGNLKRNVEHLHQDYPTLESGHFYETLEKSVHGECKTYYTVSQNGPFVKPFPFQKEAQPVPESEENSEHTNMHHGELTWHKTWHNFCNQGDQVFEIIKTVNFTSCVDKPVLGFFAPSMNMNARAGDNTFGSFGLRAVVSRVLACGVDRNQFTILKIHSEERFHFGDHHTEKLIAGGIKNFTLVEVTDKTTVPRLQNPLEISDLVYRFPRNKVHSEHNTFNRMDSDEMHTTMESSEEMTNRMTRHEKVLPMPNLVDAPLNTMLISPLKIDQMKNRVEVLMREIVDDLMRKTRHDETIADKETLSKISTVVKILRFWKYDDIQTMYKKIADRKTTDEEKTCHHVFLNTIAMAGTNPCVKFLIDLIHNRTIIGEPASQILMTLPMYIRTPTRELLKEYFKLIQVLPMEIGHRQAKTTAILSFSTLLHQACVNTNIRNTRYPVQIYGTFCDEKFVQEEFLDYFIKELEKIIYTDNTDHNMHWKVVYLNALENIGHPAVIPFVQKLMDNLINPFIKVKAVYVLKHLIVSRSNQNLKEDVNVHGVDRNSIDCLTDEVIEKHVLPILVSVAFDKGEHPEVRMAAISLLMYTTSADLSIWQQLAYLTWFEVSEEVHSYIYTSFRYMAGLERPLATIHVKLQKKARSVLSLCKPTKNTSVFTKSKNIVSSDMDYVSGFFYQLSTFGSKDSILLPNSVYFRNYDQISDRAFGFNPLEFSIHGHSTQKLVNYFWEKLWVPSTSDRQGHEDLLRIRELLGIVERKQTDKVVGSIYFKIRNEMERMFTLNKEKIDRLMREFTDITMPQLRNGLPINWHKTLHFGDNMIEIPSSIFGIPITYKYEVPVHMSLKGNIKLVTENKAVQLQADLHPVYAWKIHHRVAFKVPFVHKKYQSGVEHHMVVEFPFRSLIGRGERGQYTFALTPINRLHGEDSGKIHLWTQHKIPYTAVVRDSLWPIHKAEGAERKIIRSIETPTKIDYSVGEKILGLSFHTVIESDYTKEEATEENVMKWFHGWLEHLKRPITYPNLFMLDYSNQFVRHSTHKLTIDLDKSETKTLIFVLGGKKEYTERPEHMKMSTETDESKSSEETLRRDKVDPTWTYVLAIVGKNTPIVRCQESHGIQHVLVKNTPSTVQYMLHWFKTHDKLNVRFAIGDSVKEAAVKLPEHIPSLMAVREYLKDSTVEKTELNYCFELRGMYELPIWADRRELVVLRKRLLSEDLVVNMKNEFHFGTTCSNMPHQIKMEGHFKRGADMTEWARDKSFQAKKCIEDERKGFTVSPVCLWVAEHQAAALNDIKLQITWTDLPVVFKRMCFRLQDFLKAVFYPYMHHDRYPIEGGAGDKKIMVDWHMTPDRNFVNMLVVKPETRLIFKNMKTNDLVKKFLPLTSTQTIWENVRDRTLRTYSKPSCTLESNYISTFDNVTYNFNTDVDHNCEHVLTQDCSGKWPMAVLVRNINTNSKVVTVLLGGKTKIEIMPATTTRFLRSKSTFRVIVNGRPVEDFPMVIRNNDMAKEKFIAIIELMVNGGVQVISPRLHVATDAQRVVLYGHNAYRNRTCGLCGDFSGDRVAEFKSPKNCPLSTGTLLVASYAFNPLSRNEQCQIKPEVKEMIHKEEEDCHNARHMMMMTSRTTTTRTTIPLMFDESMESIKFHNDDEECYVKSKLVRTVEHLGVCHTENKIRRCAPGCVAQKTVTKKLWFDCVDDSYVTPLTNSIRKQLYAEVPTLCVRDL